MFPKFYRRASNFYYWYLRPKFSQLNPWREDALIYVGGNYGESLSQIAHKYRRVVVFECNPYIFSVLSKRFRNFRNVEIYPFAASNEYATLELTIPNNGNFFGSASVEALSKNNLIRSDSRLEVPSINLGSFLSMIGIKFIDFYVSDIEGHDYWALTSLRHFLEEERIKLLQIEVWAETSKLLFDREHSRITEQDFRELLPANYVKINYGVSNFKEIDKAWSVFPQAENCDILWKLKHS